MCSWSCGQKDPDDVVDLPLISTSLVLLPGDMMPPSHRDHEKAVRARQSYIYFVICLTVTATLVIIIIIIVTYISISSIIHTSSVGRRCLSLSSLCEK